MLKQYENKNRTNENEVQENSSQGKSGIKQFGLSNSQTGLNKSFKRNAEAGLKLKSNSQENSQPKSDKSLQKSALTPQKRNETNAGLKVRHDTKKQHVLPIEKTYRHREQEIEWAPEGLDLDFSPFDTSAPESYYNTKEQMFESNIDLEEYPVATRRFTVEQQDTELIESILTTPDGSIATETEQEIDHDISKIEYGPPKEIEIPYEPDQSCIIDFKDFTGRADHSAYEHIHLVGKDDLEFSAFDDIDALDQLKAQLVDDSSLEFNHCFSEDELDMTTDEDTDIPFSNYLFDVEHFIQCN